MRLYNKDNKVITMFLTILGFDYLSIGNHGEIWRHKSKDIITNITRSSNDLRWFFNWKESFGILVKENFSRIEIEILMERYIKKRKVKFTDDGKLRILRADSSIESGEDFIKEDSDEIWVTFYDVEGELLSELLPDLQDFEFPDELNNYNERYTCFYN
jgi:hypothetical protein